MSFRKRTHVVGGKKQKRLYLEAEYGIQNSYIWDFTTKYDQLRLFMTEIRLPYCDYD